MIPKPRPAFCLTISRGVKNELNNSVYITPSLLYNERFTIFDRVLLC